jgi:hypothetical protein
MSVIGILRQPTASLSRYFPALPQPEGDSFFVEYILAFQYIDSVQNDSSMMLLR